jgi:hypothetical protein
VVARSQQMVAARAGETDALPAIDAEVARATATG